MEQDKNKRRFLWIYALVLFASAFTVLLLTAFSQIKLNNNMEEYKRQLSDRENSIKEFSLNLNSAAEERKTLKQKLEQLQTEYDQLKHTVSEGGGNPELMNSKLERSRRSFDNLLKADRLYKDDKYISCAQLLRNVFEEDLGQEARQKHRFLKSKVYLYATKDYYRKAVGMFNQKNYTEARKLFEESLAYDETKYYEENSIFYLALICKKINDVESFKKYSQKLIQSYPNGEYAAKVKSLE